MRKGHGTGRVFHGDAIEQSAADQMARSMGAAIEGQLGATNPGARVTSIGWTHPSPAQPGLITEFHLALSNGAHISIVIDKDHPATFGYTPGRSDSPAEGLADEIARQQDERGPVPPLPTPEEIGGR